MKKFLGIKENEKDREKEKEKEKESSKKKHHLHFHHSSAVQHAQQRTQHQNPKQQSQQQNISKTQNIPQVQLQPLINPPPPQRTPSLVSKQSSNNINKQITIPIESPLKNKNSNSINNLHNKTYTTSRSSSRASSRTSSRRNSLHESILSAKSFTSNLKTQSQINDNISDSDKELKQKSRVNINSENINNSITNNNNTYNNNTYNNNTDNKSPNNNVNNMFSDNNISKNILDLATDSNSFLSTSSIHKISDKHFNNNFSISTNPDSTIIDDVFNDTLDNDDKTPSNDLLIESMNKESHPLFSNPSSTLGLLPPSPLNSPQTKSSSIFYNNNNNNLSYNSELQQSSNVLNQSIKSNSQTDLSQPIIRRPSVNSVSSNLTNNTESIKSVTNDARKNNRNSNVKQNINNHSYYTSSNYSIDQSFLSSNRSNNYSSNQPFGRSLSISTNLSSNQYPISSLVKPEWDNHTEKSGWVNRIDTQEPRLFRLELKGTHLLVHKPQQELGFAKNLIINNNTNNANSSLNSSMDTVFDKNFIKSKTDVSSQNINKEPIDSLNKRNETEDSNKLPIDETNENISDINEKNSSNNHTNQTENSIHSDSMLLFQAIDEYESKPNFNNGKEKKNEFLDPCDQVLELQSIEMNKKLSSKSYQSKKHLPFIIHDLFYKSPSCPHPKLVFDMKSGLILRGTLEAVCHTILFYPSDRMSDKLIEILPLISSLIDPLVYFQKYLDHFTDSNMLQRNSIKISEMEIKILFSRIKRVTTYFIEKFNGSLLDDEIFNLLCSLTNTLKLKSINYLSENEISSLWNELCTERCSLLKLVSFQLASPINDIHAPIEILEVKNSELISGTDFIMLSTDSLGSEIHAIDSHFTKFWSPRSDRSSIFSRVETIESSFQYWRFNPLQLIPPFHTHYLGRLLAYHLFEDKTTSLNAEKRAQVLMKWIHLGSKLCDQGDMVSWLGIAIFICSQAVLRLSETWGNVDKIYLDTVKKRWAPVVFEVRKNELFGTKYPADIQNHTINDNSDGLSLLNSTRNDANSNIRIIITNKIGELYAKEDAIPHFGDLFTIDSVDIKNYNNGFVVDDESTSLEGNDLFKTDFIKNYCSYLENVDWNLKQWDIYYNSIKNSTNIESKFSDKLSTNPSKITTSKDSQIANILKIAITYNASNGPFPLNYFMSLSVVIEPPYVGQFARFHGTSRSPLFLGSYASILFPELLSYYNIYDRNELISAIGGSNIIELKEPSKCRNRNISLKHVRDLFNAGSDEFRLEDGSIVFKTTEEILIESSEDEELKKSRPSSILFENPNLHKHMSTLSTGSFSLEDYITSYQTYLKDAVHDSTSLHDNNKTKTDLLEDREKNELSADSVKVLSRRVDIVTTAASTERLIDLLVLTASVFGTHIKMEDIKSYSEKSKKDGPILLQMDDSAFTCTFFATYRVFLTTKQLIDSLHKRFDGAKSAALSIANYMNSNGSYMETSNFFPQWNNKVNKTDENWKKINWKFVVQIQLGVIEATLILVNDYFKHFMDDIVTKSAFDTFLEMMDITIVSEWPQILNWLKMNTSPDEINSVIEIYKLLQNSYKHVRNLCIRKSYTPQCELTELKFSDELHKIPDYMKLPSSADVDEISLFINKLDKTVSSVLSYVRSEDWIDTFEMIQMLITKSSLSMFNYSYQDSSTNSNLIVISNIYNWIMSLSDNQNFGKSNSDKLIKKLPPTIRSIFKLYERIQQYILLQIVDPECSLDERIDRMSSLLKIIQICRVRMKNLKLFENSKASDSGSSSYLPSFIESVIINTIMLPASRFFGHAWKLASAVWKESSGGELNCERLDEMLPILNDYELTAIDTKPLSICPGWFLNALVELACFIPNMDIANTSLINFDKNRFVYNCVLKIHNLQSTMNLSGSPYSTDFSFLFEFKGKIPSLKAIYQVALNERETEKLEKFLVFIYHVNEQIQLIKLEQTKRDLLLRHREKQNVSFSDSVGKFTAHMTEPLAPEHNDVISIAASQITNEQSFIANASILDSASTYVDNGSILETSSVTAPNLADISSQSIQSTQSIQSSTTLARPSVGATSRGHSKSTQPSEHHSVNHSQNSSSSSSKFKFGFFKSRPFSLNINNFNQPVVEKRSVNLRELPVASTCIAKQKPYFTIMLKDVSIFPTYRTPNSFSIDFGTSSSSREYTFQTVDEKEVADWIYHLIYAKKHWFYSKSLNKQFSHNNCKLTFGAPLTFACERDGTPIPHIVEKILSEIELRGLEEVGIYRKSASLTVVQQIKDEVNKIGDFNMENSLVFDIHNLTGCIKAYLRDLPEPLLSDEIVKEIYPIREISQDDSRFQIYKTVLSKLPIYNYNLIERLSRHMKIIEEYKSQNKMTSYNLATIMGGSLVEGCRPETMRQSFGLMNFVCEDWILHYDRVFQ